MGKEVKFYRTESGQCPVEDFLDALTGKQAQKVVWILSLIEDMDSVPSQYFKKLVNTDDLWEVRANFGGNTFRLIGFYDEETLVILVHGFQKKSQKTPKRDIALAEERKKDYFRRKENE